MKTKEHGVATQCNDKLAGMKCNADHRNLKLNFSHGKSIGRKVKNPTSTYTFA